MVKKKLPIAIFVCKILKVALRIDKTLKQFLYINFYIIRDVIRYSCKSINKFGEDTIQQM